MSSKAFLVDTTKCTGCRACQVACKQWNGLPGQKTTFFEGTEYTNPGALTAMTWNHVVFSKLKKKKSISPVWNIMHKKCYHCEQANCITVCPAKPKAISKVDGWTVVDQEKCIGCGSCTTACVYNVPHLAKKKHVNDLGVTVLKKDKSHKCNACTVVERDIPACVTTCPTDALTIGPRLDMLKKAQERLKVVKKTIPTASIYGKDEFGGLGVITILKDKPGTFDLPVGNKAKPKKMSELEDVNNIYEFLSLFTFGIPSLKRSAYKLARNMSKKA
ncbi:4Fe-4S dicluster domain-containing protein [Spirochaetota bacterium]